MSAIKDLKQAEKIVNIANISTEVLGKYPNLSDAVSKTTIAFKNGAKGAGLFKTALSGLWEVISAHPFIAAVAAIAGAFVVIDKVTESAGELRERMAGVMDEYKTQKDALDNTGKSLKELIPIYEKLSKGVNSSGQNMSLSASEYEEYLDINNKIAELMPNLIQGYDSQGNAILSCKGNVEALTEAYNELIIAANNKLILDADGIFDNFQNFKDHINLSGLGDIFDDLSHELNKDTVDRLESVLDSSDIDSAVDNAFAYTGVSIGRVTKALKNAGLEKNYGESHEDFLKRAIKENRNIVQSIVNSFNLDVAESVSQMKSIAEAYLENELLSKKHSGISEEMNAIVQSLLSGLDFDFYDNLGSIDELYNHIDGVLSTFNNLDAGQENTIKSVFDVQTKLNDDKCTIGDYQSSIESVRSIISQFDENTQKVFNVLLGLDENGFYEDYENLKSQLASDGVFEDIEEEWLNGLNKTELSVAAKLLLNTDTADWTLETWKEHVEEAVQEEIVLNFDIEKLKTDADSLLGEVSKITETLNAQVTGTSVSLEDYNADELKDYQSALEFVNGSMRYNAEKVKELTKLKVEEKIATNELTKANLQSKYKENAAEIERLSDELEDNVDLTYDTVDAQKAHINSLITSNDAIADNCLEIDILNDSLRESIGLYQQWKDSRNASESGDMFDDTVTAFNEVDETLNDKDSDIYKKVGRVAYQASLDLIVPDTVDPKDEKAVNDYLKRVEGLFTWEDGKRTGLNLGEFVSRSLTAELLVENEAGDGYKIAGEKSMEDFAEGLDVSLPLVQAIFGELEEYGITFDWKDSNKTFDDNIKEYEDKIAETKKRIAEIEAQKISGGKYDKSELEQLKKDLDDANDKKKKLEEESIVNIETYINLEQEITQAQAEVDGWKASLEANPASVEAQANLEEAEAKLDELLNKKNQLQEPTELEVITAIENIDSEIERVKAEINNFNDENWRATYQITAEQADAKIAELNTKLTDLEARSATLNVYANTDSAVQTVTDINNTDTPDKGFNVTANDFATPILKRIDRYNIKNKKFYIYQITRKKTEDSGEGELNGNAHAFGTAYINGKWGAKQSSRALVGELGRELMVDVRTGRWRTIGDNGAEFVNVPQGAIIFNHLQTESLLSKGFVASRGVALARGTAYGGSTTASGGNIPKDILEKLTVSIAGKTSKASSTKTKATSTSSSKDDSTETIDWVETLLDRLGRAVEKFGNIADDTSKSFSARNKALEKEINATNELIRANEQAQKTYLANANAVKLSASLKQKVREGDYDISDYNSDTAELINKYKEFYDKYLDAVNELTDQKANKAALQMEKFDLVQQKYDSKFELQDAKTSYYENLDEQAELDGKGGSIKTQNSLIDIQERRKKLLIEEQAELEALFNSSTIKKGIEDWYSMQTAIQNVKADIVATDNEIAKLEDRKVEIQYERFENIAEDYDNEVALRDNRISLEEAKNRQAELQGKGGSITAQKNIISLNEEKAAILEEERTELRKQLKKIEEGTPEWYEAKQKVQDINVALVETENSILEAEQTIDDIKLDRFKNVSEDYAPKHSKTDARIAYYEDLNTEHELRGNNGSVYAQEKMMEWNAQYIEDLKAEEVDMRAKLKDMDKDSPQYQEGLDLLRDHLDKIRDAENQQIQYENNKMDILYSRYQDIQSLYDSKMSNLDHETSKITHNIDMLEAKGYRVSAELYNEQKAIEQNRISVLQEEYNKLKEAFDEAMATGKIKEGSREWYDYILALNNVEQSMYDAEKAVADLDKSIRDLEWENFQLLRDTVSELNDEADFYLELISNKDMYDDNGKLTSYGTTAMGLHGQKYNTYMAEAEAYRAKLTEVTSKLANDPNNMELIEQKRELTDAIYDNILAAEDEKQAMIDLVEEGINYELEALKELIDKYTEALDKAKDLHDYEKKIADHSSEISSLRKQISAYQGDDSQEAKLKIQQLQADLKEAEENLEETEYDKYISDQKELLDEFYNEYEENLNSRLDGIDALIGDLTSSVNSNASLINSTLTGLSSDLGVTMSEELTAIWGNSTFGQTIGDYMGKDSAIINVLTTIYNKVSDIFNKPAKSESDNTIVDSNTNSNTFSHDYNVGDELLLSNAVGYNNAGDTNPAVKNLNSYLGKNSYGDELLSTYSVIAIDGDWIGIAPSDAYKNPLYWIKSSDGNIKKYKKGGLVDYTGLAWVDGTKSNPEYMLNAEDTKSFMQLKDVLREMSKQDLNIYSNNANIDIPAQLRNIIDVSSKVSELKRGISSIDKSVSIGDVSIEIDHVQDYNDFVTQLRDDPKFEKFVRSVSTDLIGGKSRLAKNKLNWQ